MNSHNVVPSAPQISDDEISELMLTDEYQKKAFAHLSADKRKAFEQKFKEKCQEQREKRQHESSSWVIEPNSRNKQDYTVDQLNNFIFWQIYLNELSYLPFYLSDVYSQIPKGLLRERFSLGDSTFGYGPSCLIGCGDCFGELPDGVKLAMLGAAVTVIALPAGAYAAKKTWSSAANLVTLQKPLTSIFRLAGTGGGVYGGMLIGASIGATVGSAFPIVGTALGALIGTIAGAMIGGGAAALITKYASRAVTKAISKITFDRNKPDGKHVSLTNPSKYQLKELVFNKGVEKANAVATQQLKAAGIAQQLTPLEFSYDNTYMLLRVMRETKNSSSRNKSQTKKDINRYIKWVTKGKMLVGNDNEIYVTKKQGVRLFKGEPHTYHIDENLKPNCVPKPQR